MKDFKKVIKEALTPHYLRESVNEDFTHSSLAITHQSQISGLDDSELLDLLNKVSYEYTPELKNSARIISQEIEDRDLTNKIHYVDNERYEFMESVNEVTKEEIDDIENSGNIDIAYKKAMKLLNSLKDESVNESNWEKKLSKKAVHVDDDVYKKNKTQLQAAVKAYDKAESEGDIRGMELALAAVDMLKDESVNEDIVDDKAKIYWLQKLTKGEIDTLPDNPRMEYLRHAMRDQLAQDKEQLSRERNDLSKSSSLIGRMGDRNLEESVNEGYLERAIEDEKES